MSAHILLSRGRGRLIFVTVGAVYDRPVFRRFHEKRALVGRPDNDLNLWILIINH
jgi:hypothetical protein